MKKEKVLKKSTPVNYQKPLFKERKELAFPKEIWEKFNGGRFCIQCAGCHGCK